jgi:WD40 repeat protein
LTQPPPLLTERRADLPPAVNQVFARAMAKAAADRYPTCRQFAVALREALGLGGAGRDGVAGQAGAGAGHPATQAVVMSAGSLPVGADAALTQAVTPPQPVPVQPPAPMPSAYPVQSAFPVPSGAGRTRSRVHPVLLVGASVVVAAGIVAVAIIVRSPKSTPSDLGAASNPPASSRPSTGASGQVRPSTSPTDSTGGTGSGNGPASQTATGQAGFRQGGVLSPGAAGSITSVTWSPTGTLVATSDKNGSTYVWDVTAGRQAVRPLAGPGDAFAAAFSPDGTELATGYSNGTTYLWNYRTGKLLASLRDPGGANGKEVDSVAFSPDGRTLATGDGNGYTNLWKVPVGARGVRLVASLTDPAGGVFSVAFSSRGTLATGDYDGHVYIWDLASGTTTATFALAGGSCPSTICAAVSALAFSADGRMLAAGNESGAAELWSLPAGVGSPIDPPAAAAGQSIWGLSFSGSALLAMGDNDGQAYLYRIAAGGPTASIAGTLTDPNSGSQGIGTLAFSADGRYLVTGDTNGNAYLWRAR